MGIVRAKVRLECLKASSWEWKFLGQEMLQKKDEGQIDPGAFNYVLSATPKLYLARTHLKTLPDDAHDNTPDFVGP